MLLKAKDGGFLSPFLVEKLLKFECAKAEVKSIKDFSFLIKTQNEQQAEKLLVITKVGDREISITKHQFLNCSRGIIRCENLKYVEDQENSRTIKFQRWKGS